jgi:hypothetical protein
MHSQLSRLSIGASLIERFEPRVKVSIPAQIFVARTSAAAVIVNISSRGVMLQTAQSLHVGNIVDIRRGTQSLVGAVRWVRGQQAGVRLQGRIAVQAYLRGDADFVLVPARPAGQERRKLDGGFGPVDGIFAHFEWVVLLAMAVGAVAVLSSLLSRALGPLGSIHLN